jgi:hypothetical protein
MEKQADEVGRLQKRVCRGAMFFSIMAAVVFLFLGQKAIAKGLVLGTIFSVINFFLLGKSLPKVLDRSRKGSTMMGFLSIMTRYVLLAVPMIIAVKSASFDFVAVVVGIFSVQITLMLDHFFFKPVVEGK